MISKLRNRLILLDPITNVVQKKQKQKKNKKNLQSLTMLQNYKMSKIVVELKVTESSCLEI